MEEQLATAVVILDLSTAFDTVDHDFLLDILEKKFGITNNTKQWYQNYIRSRKFRIIIGKDKFKSKQLDYSVTQGSILAAFLFISYASTLDKIIKDLTIIRYADDHSIMKTFKPSQLDHQPELNTIATTERSVREIKSWVDIMQLKMNNNKTESIYFGGPKQLEKCIINQINVNGEMIPRSHITRHLGSYLNSTLNLKDHIKKKCKAAMLHLLKIKATTKFLTKETSTKAVTALVMSDLDYANSILVGLPKTSISQLQRVQNIAAKIILGKIKHESSSKCLEELHWLPIQHKINFKTVTLVFRCIHGLAPDYLEELIVTRGEEDKDSGQKI